EPGNFSFVGKPTRIFCFGSHQSRKPESAIGSSAAAGNPQLLETILLQATVECTSAQPKRFCRLPLVAIVSSQRFPDEECPHFFKTHLLEIARFAAAICQAEITCADLSILSHKHGAFDKMMELSNISRKAML